MFECFCVAPQISSIKIDYCRFTTISISITDILTTNQYHKFSLILATVSAVCNQVGLLICVFDGE